MELNSVKLLKSLPKPDDSLWTKSLIDVPQISFGTIFNFSVERKISRKKVSYLESLADFRAHMSLQEDVSKESAEELYMQTEYTRTLDKSYRFFRDGHVQDLKFHPMSHLEDMVCVISRVLASMKKIFYHVTILICKSSCSIKMAYCTCPAGLSGCCNHAIATMYCLEDYISSGLQEEEKKGCTERLQVWNRPNPQHIIGRPTDEVMLTKKVYGVEKRPKLHSINKWDCRPMSRRIVDPNKARRLRERLSTIQEERLQSTDKALHSAGTLSELKKAAQAKSLINMYGTSGYLQMLDDEPAPLESREEFLKKEKEERLSRAAEKKRKFQEELVTKQLRVQHDHKYALYSVDKSQTENLAFSATNINHLVRSLYANHVCINVTAIHELEINTRGQCNSEVWHHERQLRITASIIKEVCHRKDSTSCRPFLVKKLSPTPTTTPAMRYGIRHEQYAIESYKNYCKLNGAEISVEPCGLFVDSSEPWLAASPDGIVFEPFQNNAYRKGCLEVKCPFSCKQKRIANVCRENTSFCIKDKNGTLSLSNSHAYYYQIQTQMHVTKLPWCDFVVWSPVDDLFVERVQYNKQFVLGVITKARSFYFDVYLPAVVPCVIISEHDGNFEPLNFGELPPNVQLSECKSSGNIKPSDNVKPPENVKPMESVEPSESIKLSDSVKPSHNVKPTESVKSSESVNPSDIVKQSRSYTVKPTCGIKVSCSGPSRSKTKVCDDVVLQKSVSHTYRAMPLHVVLKNLNLARHSVNGDGSCLYHSVAHQAGFIAKTSRGDNLVSNSLRQVVAKMMSDHPRVRFEEGLSLPQWLEKKQRVMDPTEWGGDMEVRLLAIALHRDIVVITANSTSDGSYARRFPCGPPPLPKMSGGIFIPVKCDELCVQWPTMTPSPLVIMFNGLNHYDSTLSLSK